MGQFTHLQSTDLSKLGPDSIIPESDYSVMGPDGMFHQFKYKNDEKQRHTYKVNPGTWKITKSMQGYNLEPTSFVKDSILCTIVEIKKSLLTICLSLKPLVLLCSNTLFL